MKTKPIREANYTIDDGDSGIIQTVDYMWNYALRDTKEALVNDLVRQLKGKNDLATIRNIYDWVWHNIRYKLDPADREMITSPIHYVNGNRRTGDCDCMTTLLVCLLESAGFDCAITVISWRLYEYTHVYAEVWYKGGWFVLDPTLKANGFGKQDKKIIRFKRITKQDMAKLQVLADGEGLSKRFKVSPFIRRRSGCGNDDFNRNANNININFGTNTENAYNTTDGRSNYDNVSGGRAVNSGELPMLDSIYNRHIPSIARELPSPTVLRSNVRGGYDVVRNDEIPKQVRQDIGSGVQQDIVGVFRVPIKENVVSTNKQNLIVRRGLIGNHSPNYVPNVDRNYYEEFP